MSDSHPVFSRFPGYSGEALEDCQADFVGTQTHRKCLPGEFRPGDTMQGGPARDEEYFEWIDILESVVAARDRYTMIEIGAGYGRWACRAALAAKAMNIPVVHVAAVEAEPLHLEWLDEHFQRNGLSEAEFRIYPFAVAAKPGKTMFMINKPGESPEEMARQWYGQSLATKKAVLKPVKSPDYCGRRVFTLQSGYQAVQVDVERFDTVLKDYDAIDLLDFDIQGFELEVIQSCIDEIEQKTKRVHIGTHGVELEAGLRELFSSRGWRCNFDFQCQQTNETPFGRIAFNDGVQSWSNPRFAT